MLYSMTGYGRVVNEFELRTITVEIRSLNSKFNDVKIKLPQTYREKELDIRKIISDKLQRGKIDVLIEMQSNTGDEQIKINRPLFKKFFRELKETCDELNYDAPDLVSSIMRLPNVVVPTTQGLSDEEWQELKSTIDAAIEGLMKFRLDEGSVLDNDFQLRIQHIEEGLVKIPDYETSRIEKLKERLRQNLEQVNIKEGFDENRFEQELIFYLEKMDITEEKIRLAQHCKYFIKELAAKKSEKGKKLNFIGQEIGREINTIGSKANSSDIQRIVVQMKDDLEKIKEQIANIL
jgi:uncharacterized protein (TIGR00255 family)